MSTVEDILRESLEEYFIPDVADIIVAYALEEKHWTMDMLRKHNRNVYDVIKLYKLNVDDLTCEILLLNYNDIAKMLATQSAVSLKYFRTLNHGNMYAHISDFFYILRALKLQFPRIVFEYGNYDYDGVKLHIHRDYDDIVIHNPNEVFCDHKIVDGGVAVVTFQERFLQRPIEQTSNQQ